MAAFGFLASAPQASRSAAATSSLAVLLVPFFTNRKEPASSVLTVAVDSEVDKRLAFHVDRQPAVKRLLPQRPDVESRLRPTVYPRFQPRLIPYGVLEFRQPGSGPGQSVEACPRFP